MIPREVHINPCIKHTYICKYIAREKCSLNDSKGLWLFFCLLLLLMSDPTMNLQTMQISYLEKLKLYTSSTSGRMLFLWLLFFWPPLKKRTVLVWWHKEDTGIHVTYTRLTQKEFREIKQQNAQTAAALQPKKFSCPLPPGEKSQELGIWTDGIPLVLSASSCHMSGSSAASLQRSSDVKDKNQFRKQKSFLLWRDLAWELSKTFLEIHFAYSRCQKRGLSSLSVNDLQKNKKAGVALGQQPSAQQATSFLLNSTGGEKMKNKWLETKTNLQITITGKTDSIWGRCRRWHHLGPAQEAPAQPALGQPHLFQVQCDV